jgi:hypothetical protein
VPAALVEDFRARVAVAPEAVAPGPRPIDLPAIAHVSASPACTMCTLDDGGRHVFHSYRADRSRARACAGPCKRAREVRITIRAWLAPQACH